MCSARTTAISRAWGMRSGGARRNRIASPSANCTSSVDRFRSSVRDSLPKRAEIQPVSKLTDVMTP